MSSNAGEKAGIGIGSLVIILYLLWFWRGIYRVERRRRGRERMETGVEERPRQSTKTDKNLKSPTTDKPKEVLSLVNKNQTATEDRKTTSPFIYEEGEEYFAEEAISSDRSLKPQVFKDIKVRDKRFSSDKNLDF